MYCCHCGKKINELGLESKKSSYADLDVEIDDNAKVEYVCPRCGHLIHDNISEDEVKSLSRAAHSEIQRGSNSFAIGMGNLSIGIIALAIAIIFFFLAKKPNNEFQLVTTCAEFYVSMALFVISGILLVVGGVYTLLGIFKKRHYFALLNDINNQTFVQ